MRWNHKVVLGGTLALMASAGMATKKGTLEELPPAPAVETPEPVPARQDRVNYDEVGYSGRIEGAGVAIAHETLPAGSFAEVTNLSNGRTILAQVIAAGPVGPGRIVSMTPAAASQLGMEVMTPGVRVRRTNPPEHERTALRNGGQAAERLETPPALLNALRKKLGAAPAIMAATPEPSPNVRIATAPPMRAGADFPAPDASAVADAKAAEALPAPATVPTANVSVEADAAPHWTAAETPVAATVKEPASTNAVAGGWYVQVGAFSSAANARAAASRAGGGVSQAGNFYRVRTGPYASEAAARGALGQLAAKGYRDARVTR